MDDLRQLLERRLAGPVAWLGLGNVGLGDDGAGIALASRIAPALPRAHRVFLAETAPDRWVRVVREGSFSTVVLLDAVEFGAAPGAVAWFDSTEFESRFPALSTHKLPLSLLARLLAEGRTTAVSLMGIQPESLRPGRGLSPAVARTVERLARMLVEGIEDAQEVPCR